jgi:hypothetical protein
MTFGGDSPVPRRLLAMRCRYGIQLDDEVKLCGCELVSWRGFNAG